MSHHINKLPGNETTILTNLKSRVHILCNNPTARALKGSRAPKLDYIIYDISCGAPYSDPEAA